MIFAFWPNTMWYVPGEFGHITILQHENQTWVEIELDRRGLRITPYFKRDEVDDLLARHTEAGCSMVKFEPQRSAGSYLRPMTCVSLAKQIAGIKSRALFPDGLRRDLLRNSGEELYGRRFTKTN